MATFVFRLEAVLRQRKHVEREKQRELAARQKALSQSHDELRELDERVRATSEDVRRNLVGKLDMSFLTAHRRFMLAAQRQAVAIAQKIAAAQKAVDDARGMLLEAAKQRKIIEKLREKQLARWSEESHRKEMIDQDEINVQRGYESVSS
jgi:flagellar FliJ protein